MKTLSSKIRNRTIKRPNAVLGAILNQAFKSLAKKNNVNYIYNYDQQQLKGKQIVILAQHASRNDFIYLSHAFYQFAPNIIAGEFNFYQPILFSILKHSGVIAKNLFAPDINAIFNIKRAVKNGCSLMLFPEGIQSTSGSNHPINPATIRLLQNLGLHVVFVKSHGAYLSRPRYKTDNCLGKITYEMDILFTPEQLASSSVDQLARIVQDNFDYNDFEYNRQANIEYIGKYPTAHNIERILFICPKCKSKYTLSSYDNGIVCSHCGNDVKMNNMYQLHPTSDSIAPQDIDAWFKWQRAVISKAVIDPNYYIECQCMYRQIERYRLKKDMTPVVGQGTIRLDHTGLHYNGTVSGKEVDWFFDIKNMPSLPFSPTLGSFDLYYKDDYYCFEPIDNKLQIVEWMLACEELHNQVDPKWAKESNIAYQYDKYNDMF